jgi:hypothetical protein
MNKKFIIICSFLILIYLSACVHQSIIAERALEKNEYELLSELFPYLTRPLPHFLPADTTKEAMKIFNSKYDKWVSENTFELYIYDSLFAPDKDLYHSIDLNPAFDSVYQSLFQDKTLKSNRFNLSLLPERSNFKLIPINPDPTSDSLYENISKNEAFMGFFEFSRIAFNKNYSKACFYFARHMGPKSGGGEIIFVEKRNRIWTIVERKMIWVS